MSINGIFIYEFFGDWYKFVKSRVHRNNFRILISFSYNFIYASYYFQIHISLDIHSFVPSALSSAFFSHTYHPGHYCFLYRSLFVRSIWSNRLKVDLHSTPITLLFIPHPFRAFSFEIQSYLSTWIIFLEYHISWQDDRVLKR